jgi:hypothetical protein
MPAYIRNVAAIPKELRTFRNVDDTMRFDTQLAIVAMAKARPRNSIGKISLNSSQFTNGYKREIN